MGKIVVTEFISADGVIEDPGGAENYEHGGWSFQIDRGEDGNKFKLDETMATDALLLGRVTYQGFADAWPSRGGEFADKFNSMPKFVVSTTLNNPEWNNSTVISGDVAAEVGELKDRFANDVVVHGSAQLVNTLKEHDLVDEYRLMVFPVVLGKGKRLFSDGGDLTQLKLADARQVGPDGVIILTYERAPK
jgi:dihydrofolate reductase